MRDAERPGFAVRPRPPSRLFSTCGIGCRVRDRSGSRQQRWVIDPGNGAIISLGGKCLDVQGAQVNSDGSTVWSWDCNQQVQQRWFEDSVPLTFPDGKFRRTNLLKNLGGRCLDVHAPDQFKNGARVQIWTCNNTMQQDWIIADIP